MRFRRVAKRARDRVAPFALLGAAATAAGQPDGQPGQPELITYKAAVVALTDDPELRTELERGLVGKARAHDYDAVASSDLLPDLTRLDDRGIARRLGEEGIQAVLMARPASLGAGATLESVRDDVSADTYANMRKFAREVSPSESGDVVAVVHMAIYVLEGNRAELVSSGAVWLNEQVDDRDEAMERLQNLIVANVDLVRPQIRDHLRLPPLP